MINYLNQICVIGREKRRDAITSILESLGISYSIVGNYTKNIVVSFNKSERHIVIGAHYDAYYEGANDNGVACNILLNLIKDLRDTSLSVDFVFFDKEEEGGIGSIEYIKNTGRSHITGMLNLDMCGMGENIIETHCAFGDAFDIPMFNEVVKGDIIHLNELPFGDYNVFARNHIPAIFIINSTAHDVAWFEDYANGVSSRITPDFLKTMHQRSDTVSSLKPDAGENIYRYLKERLR